MQILLTRNTLPLIQPLLTAKGAIRERTVWVLQIADGSGRVGLGEAAPLPAFGTESPEVCAEALRQALKAMDVTWIRAWLMRGRYDAPLGDSVEGFLAKSPCARSAVEGALIDLLAQQQGHALAAALSNTPAQSLSVNALISGDAPIVAETARSSADAGFTCMKLKLSSDISAGLACITAVRRAVGDTIQLRVDANGAWTFEQALAFAIEAGPARLEYCEQPLAPDQLTALATLRRRTGMNIAVDEDVRNATDIGAVTAAQAADVVILKPAFLGGWRPTRQAVELAQRCGLGVVITTAIDGAIGRAHATHYAAALNLTDRAHGLATGNLLAEDLTHEPLGIQRGHIVLREQPGLGIGALRR